MLSYVIVGSGYRSAYFGRIASAYPELFRAMYFCRSSEKAALISKTTGIRAVTSVEQCIGFQPDFIVIAVDRGHVADVAEEWIQRGYPVVTETPVADTWEKCLRLWSLALQGARIVCCEQYHRQPLLAAGLDAVSRGIIGTPSSASISLVHDYHAASILRKALMLKTGASYTLRGIRQKNEVAETDSRYGAIWDGSTRSAERDFVHISFSSGQEAVYDFSSVQYRSFIRARHLTVRGSLGEWSDTQILCLDEQHIPRRIALTPDIPERYRILDTQALRDRRRNWTAELAPDTVQDEFAMASILLDMQTYLQGGPSPYPLEEALDDACFWLLLEEAVRSPWHEVLSPRMPWHH